MQTLLIVDDRADNRKLLRLSLGHLYRIIEAADAATAWSLLVEHQPRGVILDVMMPGGMDGFDLCAKIRADADPQINGTYVLLLTARGQASDRERGRVAGADDYVVKPYSPLALLKTLEQRIGT
jgi:two-component system, OmpR family, phosphate regulon response regulator PhoB